MVTSVVTGWGMRATAVALVFVVRAVVMMVVMLVLGVTLGARLRASRCGRTVVQILVLILVARTRRGMPAAFVMLAATVVVWWRGRVVTGGGKVWRRM